MSKNSDQQQRAESEAGVPLSFTNEVLSFARLYQVPEYDDDFYKESIKSMRKDFNFISSSHFVFKSIVNALSAQEKEEGENHD